MKPILLGLLGAFSLTAVVAMAPETSGAAEQSTAGNAFDHEFKAIDDGKLPLSQYRGKVLLVVNTASFCGYTHQYAGLQKLWETYEGRGLVVIGVPSNDFGAQEPKAEGEIKEFCEGAFGITFPLTAKYPVRGQNAHPFYKWTTSVLGASATPRWNFTKILVARDGSAVASYGSSVTPSSRELVAAIEHELQKP
jgi:glutathione peroxidase